MINEHLVPLLHCPSSPSMSLIIYFFRRGFILWLSWSKVLSPWLMVPIPFPASGRVIPQHLLAQLRYIFDPIMSLFWEPTIRKQQEKGVYFFPAFRMADDSAPTAGSPKGQDGASSSTQIRMGWGSGTWRQQTNESASASLLAVRGEE